MCGIAGVAGLAAGRKDMACVITRMTHALRHRGPDGAGMRLFTAADCGTPVGLGHRRLAIIDLSDCGLQPMCNEDESIWVVFNGEIYNFLELRRELQVKGHRFRSGTDTEVLVHLYEELGHRLVERLVGMFAFAILDTRSRKLLLARDHLGVKPLYYHLDSSGLVFGSEIKALLAALSDRPAVNWQGIYDYFTFLYVPGPQTAYEGIQQLLPAHVLQYDLDRHTHTISCYWRMERRCDVDDLTTNEIEKYLFDELRGAVQRELISDVPLGIFLSGGIDSSVLAGLAVESGVRPHTFTVDFAGSESRYYSEAKVAEDTSRHLGTEHRTLTVDRIDPIEMLGLIDYFDQPFGNPTFYLQWLISKHARSFITVALNGAGGDELFAGYPRYRAAALARTIRFVPRAMLRGAERSLGVLRDNYRSMHLRRAREFLAGVDTDPVRQFTNWTYFLTPADKARLFSDRGESRSPSERHLRSIYDGSEFADDNRLLHVDLQSFLVDNLLEYTDRMSMAVSMEIRVPLLEPEFVNRAMNVPFDKKLGRRGSKLVMRDAFRQFLTPAVRSGAKRGFNAPLGQWMRRELDEYFVASKVDKHRLKDRLGSDIGATWLDDQILDWNYIDSLREAHHSGRQDLSHELFSIIAFDVWWRKYVRGTLPIEHWAAA